MDFGKAIEALKQGKKVRRSGWNGRGMFLWLKPGAEIKSEWCKDPMLRKLADENGGTITGLPTICMFTHDSTGRKAILTGWLASQSDMLLDDWEIVSENGERKQFLKRGGVIALMVTMVCALTGCLAPTQTVIEELDPATGQTIKRTTTSESVVKTVTDSTRDKWVLVSKQGWAGGLRAIPPASSAENPAGCFELIAGKDDTLMSTMPMEKVTPEVAATVIDKLTSTVAAARSGKLEFGATGIAAGSDGKNSEP